MPIIRCYERATMMPHNRRDYAREHEARVLSRLRARSRPRCRRVAPSLYGSNTNDTIIMRARDDSECYARVERCYRSHAACVCSERRCVDSAQHGEVGSRRSARLRVRAARREVQSEARYERERLDALCCYSGATRYFEMPRRLLFHAC